MAAQPVPPTLAHNPLVKPWTRWTPRRRMARIVWPELVVAVALAAAGHYLFAILCGVIALSHARTLLWLAHMVAITRVVESQADARNSAINHKIGVTNEEIAAAYQGYWNAFDLETQASYWEDHQWVSSGRP